MKFFHPYTSAALLLVSTLTAPVAAQTVESVGTRALGMGGAFVAVANDSSATWWNPAGLAAGPFLDLGLGRARTWTSDELPARRDTAFWFALATPPFGVSYYRTRLTAAAPEDPTGDGEGDRQDGRAGTPVRSLSASQLGATVVQTLLPGVHGGATLKYVRGTVRSREDATGNPSSLLDAGDDLEGGDAGGAFDLDLGLHATAGAFSVAAVVRNVREPEFANGAGVPIMKLPRQVRVGAAFDGDRIGRQPLTVAIDADLRSYATGTGDRRVVAVGAERWFAARRLGVRAGARFNTVGAEDRTATGGVSVALRSGLYLDGYAARGGDAGERGWGATVRVSF